MQRQRKRLESVCGSVGGVCLGGWVSKKGGERWSISEGCAKVG